MWPPEVGLGRQAIPRAARLREPLARESVLLLPEQLGRRLSKPVSWGETQDRGERAERAFSSGLSAGGCERQHFRGREEDAHRDSLFRAVVDRQASAQRFDDAPARL